MVSCTVGFLVAVVCWFFKAKKSLDCLRLFVGNRFSSQHTMSLASKMLISTECGSHAYKLSNAWADVKVGKDGAMAAKKAV